MTRINKMVMHGFKSFAKRTELLFGGDFNCVLGPNGSGKSNILDSLCFVLGKSSSKSLRAEKSSNLIYNGGKLKKPSKSGEVSLYFDNSSKVFPTEEAEVKISRIVKPDGSSKYKINDQSRTRQQILDLLSLAKIDPNGYNIILQGDIVRFVEMSPLDRRLVIEEISGISLYEEKKNKAVKELEKVDGRLNESEIILKERSTYLKELKDEHDQAMKFKAVDDDLKTAKASMLKIKINEKEDEKSQFDSKISAHKQEIDKFSSHINSLKQSVQKKKEEIGSITREVEEKGETDQVKLQKEIEQLRVDTASNQTRISSCENEINRINQRKDQLQKNLSEIDGRIDGLESQKKTLSERKGYFVKEQEAINTNISDFKKKHKLEQDTGELDTEMVDIDRSAEEKQKEIQSLREQQQELLRQKDRIEFQVQTIDNQIKKVREIEKEHKDEIDQLKEKKEKFKQISEELNKLLDTTSVLSVEQANTESKLSKSRGELEKLKLKDISIKETGKSNIAVKKILENKEKFGTIHGTISELGTVSQEYSLALEVAAGPRANSIVVDTEQTAAKCIKYLKQNKLGTATFLPLNKIKGPRKDPKLDSMKSRKGVHGLASDVISYDPIFNNAFSYVFGNTVVVDDIDTATRIGIGTARMVTLSGDLSELSGAMQGGFRHKRAAGFMEEDVSQKLEALASGVKELEKTLSVQENSRKETDDKITSLREKKAALEGDIIKTERCLHLDSKDVDASRKYKNQLIRESEEVDEKINEIGSKISDVNSVLAEVKIKKQQLRDKIVHLKNPRLVAELNAFEEKKAELKEKIAEIDTEFKGVDLQVSDILGRDKENTIKILKEIAKEEESFTLEIGQLKEKISSQSKELKQKDAQQQKFYSQFKQLFNKRSVLNDEVSKSEADISVSQERMRVVEQKMNALSIENARLKAELAGLREEFAQFEGVELDIKKSADDLRKTIAKLEQSRETMGSVNMKALEIYEAVEKEYNSLLEKKEKLESEKDSVIKMMDEIESKKFDLFMKTFNSINDNFKRIFSSLSPKGEAYLDLENPEVPFEEGLRIRVKITGSKFLDIRSLSGGEKTMTALAFIFSIQEYEPATFYIMDEVDAALDKHNSEKLAKLIKKYSENAQYIMVTHNDAIISNADLLYGISMNEHGMSNVISLKI